jgi:hypothetical protein
VVQGTADPAAIITPIIQAAGQGYSKADLPLRLPGLQTVAAVLPVTAAEPVLPEAAVAAVAEVLLSGHSPEVVADKFFCRCVYEK